MTKILLNQSFVDESEAKVPFNDRGYNFGDGIYEYIRVYDGKLFTSKEHFERLLRSAAEIGLDLNHTVESLTELVRELAEVNQVVNGGIYIQVTRGVAPRDHAFPTPPVEPVITGFAKHYDRPYEALDEGVSAVTTEDIRWLRCDIKSLNLLGNVLAKEYASKYNATEAIQHRDGVVTEGASSNVYAIKDNVVYTHPVSHLILNGITRQVIKWVCEDENITMKEEPFTVAFLKEADEVIISSTSVEVMPIVTLDGESVNDGKVGPITRQLQKGFERYIRSHSH
ncbi:D-amino-acid transaminase [Staphylococcus coagulans]|uniref:D-amino-acid transaminase n=1 Tax=Staphylococcus coagulans TaxID=74706 RepID=UPI00067A1CD9|nr:D-amino-acid transaminase [Staphylococcus coagulans]AKS66840.1 D-alanine aminotransferase [Staphylococcus schleiferi]MBA8763084.1 D-amino-acid transaminase [Staphylococcus coagulans]MBA8773204.1 D-amino-acid transaminase [Staphylococcus coagulans]MBT2808661.1 D-amino-acid transaminase [Staphylococcus coagulans]MBT2810905.1 D-amino-acid transaminase [Staphylococcus coagulans]